MKRIPKIDLHLHIDGSVYPETALALAQEQGLPEGTLSLEEITRRMVIPEGENGTEFKEFDLPIAVMQTAGALRRVTRELVCRLAKEGVLYAELRFAPQFHTTRGLTQREVIAAALEGAEEGVREHPRSRSGCCSARWAPSPRQRKTALQTSRRCASQRSSSTRAAGWSASTSPAMRSI